MDKETAAGCWVGCEMEGCRSGLLQPSSLPTKAEVGCAVAVVADFSLFQKKIFFFCKCIDFLNSQNRVNPWGKLSCGFVCFLFWTSLPTLPASLGCLLELKELTCGGLGAGAGPRGLDLRSRLSPNPAGLWERVARNLLPDWTRAISLPSAIMRDRSRHRVEAHGEGLT